jgi:tetratricopeptide (TPR) repeat protein
MFLYPEWSVSARSGFWWLPLGGAVAVTALLGGLASARTGPGDRLDAAGWARPAWFAWGYFWVSLVPVLGFVDVYYMRYAPVADHYQHLAIIGVAVGVAAAWRPCAARLPAGSARAVPLAVLAVLGLLTWRQCLMYRDNRSLYLTAISRNPRAWLAEFNWGEQLLEKGRAAGAIDYFAAALRAKPDYFEAHNNLGIALAESGRAAEAAAQFEEAVRLNPAYAPAHLNLGKARLQQRRGPEAMAQFREAAQLNPRDAEARRALGLLLRALGREAEARDELAAAARLDRRP